MKHIVLIHGNSLSSEVFKHQLSDTNLQSDMVLHAIDLPGHGQSPRQSAYSLEGFIDHLIGYINEQEISEVGLVGHSLGGHLAIDMLSHDLPFRVNKIMIFGTPPLKKPVEMSAFQAHPAVASAFKGELSHQEVDDLANAFGSIDFKDMILRTDQKVRADIGAELANGNTLDELSILGKFEGKVAVIHGSDDPLVNLDYIETLNLDIWQNEVQLIEGAGHSPQYERPDTFNILFKSFF